MSQNQNLLNFLDLLKKKNLDVNYVVHGGKISIGSLGNFLQNGYKKDQDKNIDGYLRDDSLSGQRATVYHNPEKNHTVVTHKGTQSATDWLTNLRYGLFNDTSGKRFEHAKKIQNQAEEKYKDSNITTVGHSLGSKLAHEATKNNKERDLVTLNGAVTPYDIGKKNDKSVTTIRTKLDPVSALTNLQRKNGNEIAIKSKSINPLTEHSTTCLDRLDPNMVVGKGIISNHHDEIIKRLQYRH